MEFKKWLKGQRMPGETHGWAYTFDGKTKWHQIDNYGTVRCLHAPCLPPATPRLPACQPAPSAPRCGSPASTSWANGWPTSR